MSSENNTFHVHEHDVEEGTSKSTSSTTEPTSLSPLIDKVPSANHASSPSRGVTKRITTNSSTNADSAEGRKIRKVKRLRKKNKEDYGPLLKYGSLVLLVAQLVGLVLLMRYTRTSHDDDTKMYLSSTAVFNMEVLKLVTCNVVLLYQSDYSAKVWAKELYDHVWNDLGEMAKVSVPSFLYVVQNNLLYLALTNLDAATYQVCYQLKILTTAVFSAVMLQRRFSSKKWLALVLLTIGVAIVQTAGTPHNPDDHSHDHHDASHDTTTSSRSLHQHQQQLHPSSSTTPQLQEQNPTVGILAILCAACTSGFSGVYFEKILKGSSTSLWIRNVQMGIPSVLISLLTAYVHDGETIGREGFFVGYTPLVWAVVVVQAVGGLIVAVVIKYADNVLKTFAASVSIVVSCVISAVFLDFRPNGSFLVGTAFVVVSTVMYSQPDKKVRRRLEKKKKSVLPVTNGSVLGHGTNGTNGKKSALV